MARVSRRERDDFEREFVALLAAKREAAADVDDAVAKSSPTCALAATGR